MECKCKGCVKRYPACHDTCPDYQAFKKEQFKMKERKYKDSEVWSYMKTSYDRVYRKNKYKLGGSK